MCNDQKEKNLNIQRNYHLHQHRDVDHHEIDNHDDDYQNS